MEYTIRLFDFHQELLGRRNLTLFLFQFQIAYRINLINLDGNVRSNAVEFQIKSIPIFNLIFDFDKINDKSVTS